MSEIVVRHFDPSFLDELVRIEKKTVERFPDFPDWARWVYRNSPEMKAENMFTAHIGSQVTGYGHLIPRPAYDGDPPEMPHTVYLDLNAELDAECPERVFDALYAAICRRTEDLVRGWPERRVELCVQHYTTEQPYLDYLLKRGFSHAGGYHLLERDLAELPLPTGNWPDLREWVITTRADKERYLELNKLAFPEETLTIEHIDGRLNIPCWRTFVIDNELGQVIGLITVRSEMKQQGYIENLLVLPEYRRRGYAEALLNAGLTRLREMGFRFAQLHVEHTNTPALRLYQKASFISVKEQVELRLVWGME